MLRTVTHWAAVVGGVLAIVGSAILAIDLFVSKRDASEDADMRLALDALDGEVRTTVVNINKTFANSQRSIAKYLGLLEMDLEPVWQALDRMAPDVARETSIAARMLFSEQLEKSAASLDEGIDGREALARIADAQRRIQVHFDEQVKTARRMRLVAVWGVVLVSLGTVGALVDAAISG